MHGRRRHAYWLALVVLALACGTVVIWHWASLGNLHKGPVGLPNGDTTPESVDSEKQVDGGALPRSGCQIKYVVSYAGCGHSLVTEEAIPAYLEGRTFEDLSRIFSNWQITVFSPYLVELTLKKDGLCPEDEAHRFITLKDGYVAVYKGKSALEIKELRLDMPESVLSEADRRRLRAGITVPAGPGARDENVNLLLEGLVD